MNYEIFQGGVEDNFQFQMDDDTEVFYSCSATLNDELFVFGGYSNSNNKRKQVFYSNIIWNYQNSI